MKFNLLLFTLFLVWSCDQRQIQIFEKGFLEGKVTIGPLCPVEKFPPDPACEPTEETYKAWPIVVWTADKKTKIAKIQPDLDGNYNIDLPGGSYIVDLEKQHMFGMNLPATVDIDPSQTLTFNIEIDTGIR